jgi:hypothetical protein
MACAVWVKEALTVAKACANARTGSSVGSGVALPPQAERSTANILSMMVLFFMMILVNLV